MTMKKLNPIGRYITQDLIGFINHLIDWNNALEARLAALEHPVERLSDETAPKCNCMVVNDKRVCPQHDAVITNDHKC